MRPIVAIFLLLFGSLAGAQVGGSYFPIRKQTGDEGVTAFEAQWYAKSLKRINEPCLPGLVKDPSVEMYRITILPTWGNPIVVRLRKQGETYALSARRLDGQGGYDPGKLVESKEVNLSLQDSRAFEALLHKLDFFHLRSADEVLGKDGDQSVLEGVYQGRYHVITRWTASYHTAERGLIDFADLCKFMIDKSTLSERPRNKGHKLI
jgi:hypothetical protein